ncbi:MAG TPA: tRNA pseudouridine(55) synthase TruB [Dehalococcoidia bacterium]|nr:tRNA pseudouridine(55) synthase TruB [Dehalococcoidia bacterium]
MAKSRNGPPLKNGFVNLYKPVGITSMEALRQVKRITGQRNKVGHGGTMDPLAQGVLPVCFGQATRLMDFVVSGRKRYRMEVTLGVSTTTYDAEGETVNTMSVDGITQEHVEKALPPFVGNIDQLPPVYSALKVQGQRMYKLARAGVEVEREPRPVEIYDIRLLEFDLPKLVLEVDCGKGAYMRSLAHDLGESLGCGGHVVDLIRLSTGRFHADDSITPLQLEQAVTEDGGWEEHLYPVDWVLKDLRSVSVGKQAENLLRNGQTVSLGPQFMDAAYLEPFRAYSSEGRFLALVRFERPANSWRPVKVFQLDDPSPLAPET